jgi:hypothetical protein
MAQRYIYLADELNLRLKKEENASGLIQNLLEDYYKKKEFRKMNKTELKKFIDKKKLENEYKLKLEKIENGN